MKHTGLSIRNLIFIPMLIVALGLCFSSRDAQAEIKELIIGIGIDADTLLPYDQTTTLMQNMADLIYDSFLYQDPEGKLHRSGAEVKQALFAYLDEMQQQSQGSPRLSEFYAKIRNTSLNYAPGLFHSYDVPGLPRTNNDRESEFRNLNRRLLSTTGQRGLVKRIIHRQGAWELIPHPDSLSGTVIALAQVDSDEFAQERRRIRNHRGRFRLHTRSPKQSQAQLDKLAHRWDTLTLMDSS